MKRKSKSLISMIFLLIILCTEGFSQNDHHLVVENTTEQSILLHVFYLQKRFTASRTNISGKASKPILLKSGQSLMPLSGYGYHYCCIYVEFPEQGTDMQYIGPDREKYRMGISKGRHALRNPSSRNKGAVNWTPIYFTGQYDTVQYQVSTVSNCKGNCWDGSGVLYNYEEMIDGEFKDGVAHGSADYTIGDTTFSGDWHYGQMNGDFVIETKDKSFRIEGEYIYGLPVGHFKYWIGNDRIKCIYNRNGQLHGKAILTRPITANSRRTRPYSVEYINGVRQPGSANVDIDLRD